MMMKLTIFGRLSLGYAAIMVLVVFQGGYTTIKLNQIHYLNKTIDLVDGAAIRLSQHLSDELFSQVAFEKKYLVSRDSDFHDQFYKTSNRFLDGLTELENLAATPQKKTMVEEARRLYARYLAVFREEAGLIKINADYSIEAYRNKKDHLIDNLDKSLGQIIKISRQSSDEMIRASNRISQLVLNFTAITVGMVIFLGILISFFNTRSINRPISILKKKTKDISEGNFEVVSAITSPPEIMELDHDFNVMCERLKELEEMKIDFVSHVSHELRTPLTIIKEGSNMLLEGTYRDSIEKQHELLVLINDECERLITSVNRILDLSRMEGGMMTYHYESMDFKCIVEKSVSKIRPLFERKGIQLELDLSDAVPYVAIDKERIEQVMENLLGNALKYTPKDGSVCIRLSRDPEDGDYLKISISDTGSGIKQEDLKRIFDKFQRIESGKETVRGTGLGLSIAKHIISAHRGKIWVESTAGKGSTFYFTLRVCAAC
ncbi:MAG: HAMP domain-containing sensor histidine kinase [Desulfobacterales bacterium]